MKETILALLTAKFSGVRKDVLNQMARVFALQAATEEEAKTLVEKVTDAQVNDFAKEYRADVDREVSESNKTMESNLKKKFDFVEKGGKKVEPEPKQAEPNDLASLVKTAVADAVKPLQDKLAGYEAENTAKSRLQQLTEKLNGCKDENFKAQTLKDFARMKFETEDEFAEYLNDKAKDIETTNQSVADMALRGGSGSPLFAQKEESGISKGVADYIESQKPANEQFGGKDL
ncbi:MAG: hypothetical protein NC324_02550 [Bacteroides sp.]|nr:hypothetical protein [Bacteroides sp.]